jgi:hypothetical protein
MRDQSTISSDSSPALICFTAELADAVYFELLRSRIRGSWLDLKIDLWTTLAETVRQRLERLPLSTRPTDAVEPWREAELAELTDAAYRIGLRYGPQCPFLDVELGLHRALEKVIQRLPARYAVAARLWRLRAAGHA